MYNLAYKLDTKEFLGCRFDPEPKEGEGMIQIEADTEVGDALKNGWIITINEDLSITTTEPEAPAPTPLDIARQAVKDANGQAKRDAMTDYLILKEGLE